MAELIRFEEELETVIPLGRLLSAKREYLTRQPEGTTVVGKVVTFWGVRATLSLRPKED